MYCIVENSQIPLGKVISQQKSKAAFHFRTFRMIRKLLYQHMYLNSFLPLNASLCKTGYSITCFHSTWRSGINGKDVFTVLLLFLRSEKNNTLYYRASIIVNVFIQFKNRQLNLHREDKMKYTERIKNLSMWSN